MRELLAVAMPERDDGTREGVLAALRARESVLSTGVGDGVAIPHAKTPLVDDLIMAAGVSERPIEYDALDGRPVRLFFLLLGPEAAAGAHVRALGRISRVLRREPLRQALIAAPDADTFFSVIAASESG